MSDVTPLSSIRAEIIKFRSIRSSQWGMGVLLLLTVGISLLIDLGVKSRFAERPEIRLGFDPTANSMGGVFLSQLVVGVVGVMVITNEYSSGSIRTSLAAVPRRNLLVLGKVFIVTLSVFVVTEIATLVSYFVGQSIYAGTKIAARSGAGVLPAHSVIPHTSLSSPGALRAVIFAALVLTLLALCGLGLGLIVRTTAASISIYVALLLVAPMLVGQLPASWSDHINQYLPLNLLNSAISQSTGLNSLSPVAAVLTLVAYAAVLIGVGTIRLNRRDA